MHARTNGQTDAQHHHAMTIARWPSASGANYAAGIQARLPFSIVRKKHSTLGSVKIKKINYLPNNKFLDMTKFKAIADDNSNVAKMVISLFDRAENIVGKGENAGYQHFLLFPQCFQKASFPGSLSRDCVVKSQLTNGNSSRKLHM